MGLRSAGKSRISPIQPRRKSVAAKSAYWQEGLVMRRPHSLAPWSPVVLLKSPPPIPDSNTSKVFPNPLIGDDFVWYGIFGVTHCFQGNANLLQSQMRSGAAILHKRQTCPAFGVRM